MSFECNFGNINLLSPIRFSPRRCRRAFQIYVWRHQCLKLSSSLLAHNQLGKLVPSNFENLFDTLVSPFPSVNSLYLVALVLGLVSFPKICLFFLNK